MEVVVVALSARCPRPSLADDGFAPIFPVVPLPVSHRSPLEAVLAHQEIPPERLELPPPEPEPKDIWLDDPSYQAAAFRAGL